MRSSRYGVLMLSAALILCAAVAEAVEPCCEIAAINVGRGVVTGKVTATGRTFEFVVNDAVLLKELKVGQQLQVDFTSNTVTIPKHQFKITKLGAQPVGATAAAVRSGRAPLKFSLLPPDARGFFTVRNVQSGQVARHRASSSWLKAFSRVHFVKNGGVQGQTEGGAEADHQGLCDQLSQTSNGGRPCRADCVMTTSGSDPTDIDDEFSCTCICS